jgi:hypothetical protein
VVVDGEMRLVLPVGLTVSVDSGGRTLVQVGVVHLLHRCRGVGLHNFPALAVVKLHPVVLTILNLAGALEGLGEELAQVVVVGSVLEAEIANVAEVLVEFLYTVLVLFHDSS